MSGSGLSGAQVLVVGNDAVKMGYETPNRVVEQGEWLMRVADDGNALHLPRVKRVLPRGYVMEALEQVSAEDVEFERVALALDFSVWRHDAAHQVDTPQTLLKVDKILSEHAPELLPAAIEQLAFIRPTEPCLTHGDPTAENVMLRDGVYVVIDPIPSTPAIPDDLAVDAGKMLQSAHGWEAMKGEARATWTRDDLGNFFPDEVMEVADLWCIVHFIRTLPYASKEVKDRALEKTRELLGVRR